MTTPQHTSQRTQQQAPQFAKLLNLRKVQKKRKPWFVVKESKYRGGRVAERWRFPIGRHSRVRRQCKGRPALVHVGYGSPAEVRGLHPSGKKPVLVHQEKELLAVHATEEGAVIGRTVGNRKRLHLLQLAQQKQIVVLGVKNLAKEIEAITLGLQTRKETKIAKKTQKTKKQQEKEKKSIEKEQEKKKEQEKEAQEKKEEHKKTNPENN
ncbi:hypothetical protein HYX13_01645 [Candidatus Woesearchaeota archaeon]|nr:hypothetical protein [Candidatus Woesearchaeota archaeon]